MLGKMVSVLGKFLGVAGPAGYRLKWFPQDLTCVLKKLQDYSVFLAPLALHSKLRITTLYSGLYSLILSMFYENNLKDFIPHIFLKNKMKQMRL